MPSFLSGWGKRKAIKYGTTIPGSNLTDFDLLIQIVADSDIGAELSGRKFAVTEADGTTQVPYGHYNDFDLTGGDCTFTLRALFDLDSGASTGDVLGYLYYDDGQTDQTNRSGVAASWVIYAPLEEDPSGSSPQMVDWTGNYNGTSHGSMTSGDLVAAVVGNGLDLDGSNDYIDFGQPSAIPGAANATLMGHVGNLIANTGFGFPVNEDNRFEIEYFSGTMYWVVENGGPSYPNCSVSTSGSRHLALAYDGSASGLARIAAYIDGSLQTLSAGGNNPAATIASSGNLGNFEIGRLHYGGTFGPGIFDEIKLSASTLSADWIAFTYANETSNSSTVTLGTEETPGGGGYTLTADAGAFTLTGQSATLKATRTLPVAAGSFTLTGQAAALKAGHVVTAAVGTFTLTGQAAGLSATRTVAAATGSFTLSGQAATLKATRTMPAAVGTFTLSGQDVGLVVPGKLTADAGAFTVSGQDVSLRVGRTLACSAGSFTFTGQSAGLACTRRLTVSSGSFVLTGQSVTLTSSGVVFDPLTFYLTSSRDNSIALTSESETTFNLISRRG